MDEERNLEAIAEEFIPDEEEIERQITEEWEARHQRGETIRVGEASKAVFLRWLHTLGLDFFAALHRKGWIRDDEDEDE
jgi:hypothetical protein